MVTIKATGETLFDPVLPPGFRYHEEFIDVDAERSLLEDIQRLEFSTFEMRGVAARRRVAFFGASYNPGTTSVAPLPPFLLSLRERIAEWARLEAESLSMALINEYPPGAPIGWHRDAPQYGLVVGLSLLSACRMTLRPYISPSAQRSGPGIRRVASHEIILHRRSIYLMARDARDAYEHHIPPVTTLRYSVTFRTLRREG